MAELQTIPARHGVATFVPAGQTIKIVNTSGTQVIDTWAFALPKPDEKKGENKEEKQEEKKDGKQEEKQEEPKQESKTPAKQTPKKKKDADLPSQEDAEKATQDLFKEGEHTNGSDATDAKSTPQKSTWSSYVPSLGLSSKKGAQAPKKEETEQQKNSRTWSSYFPSGKGFSNYIPKSASDTVSSFAQDVSIASEAVGRH
jgi:outer membrane biosynthesis protein TonB